MAGIRFRCVSRWVGGGGHPIMSYSSEAPPERPHFVSPQVYVRPGISLVEVFKRVKGSREGAMSVKRKVTVGQNITSVPNLWNPFCCQ